MKKVSLPVLIVTLVVLFFLNGCGVKWGETVTKVNLGLPDDFAKQHFLSADFSAPIDPKIVAGSLLIKVNDTIFNLSERHYCKNDTAIIEKRFNDRDVIYYSKITDGFSANGSFAIAGIKATQDVAYEVNIDRYLFAEITHDNVDTSKLFQIYRNILRDPDQKPYNYYYIKAVQVNTLITKAYIKSGASATVDGGTSTFGASGNVYKSNESFSKQYTVGVKLVPLPILILEYANVYTNEMIKSEEELNVHTKEIIKSEEGPNIIILKTIKLE